jgi:hypothetical protein
MSKRKTKFLGQDFSQLVEKAEGKNRQNRIANIAPEDEFAEESIALRAEQAAANPEGAYSQLVRDQFDDWFNRIFPKQQEAIDIAMGNDRERRALELGQQQLSNEIMVPHINRDAMRGFNPQRPGWQQTLNDMMEMRPIDFEQVDYSQDPDFKSRVLDTGYRALAGQERQEVGDTTRRAFDIGAGVSGRNRQRYGLNIGGSETQQRGREVNQALSTVGGVNSMRDGLRDRQDYLMTGTSSAMGGIFNQMAG